MYDNKDTSMFLGPFWGGFSNVSSYNQYETTTEGEEEETPYEDRLLQVREQQPESTDSL